MFFSEKEGGTEALIIHPDLDISPESLSEIQLLASSAGASVIETVTARIRKVHQTYFIGHGKLKEAQQIVKDKGIDLVIVNASLSPSQERNIEKELQCRVIDRNRLILDIFAQRAQSHEGKLQVELAQLEYISTRLIRGWTHLERQKGGIGLRGPGESQLETDRRLLSARVVLLKKKLQQVRKQRQQNRQNRTRFNTKTLALVGYTNAGKSTIFNSLTESESYVADQLFATLDTTSRKLLIPGIGDCMLTDTVGFVKNLPHTLIEAFKATLEEVKMADIIIQVVDASDPNYENKLEAVQKVLNEIEATNVKQIVVFNKIDKLDQEQRLEIAPQIHIGDLYYPTVAVSALSKEGQEQLLTCIAETLSKSWYSGWLSINAANAGQIRSELYQLEAVSDESNTENGDLLLRVNLPRSYLSQHTDIKMITP